MINISWIFSETGPSEGQNYVILIVKYKQNKYEFNIEVGKESGSFAAELIKAKEG